jgi:CheY-like chemotaxis protein
MLAERSVPPTARGRIVICDYNALLLSVTGLLRMSGYHVFQAHDGWAAQELCVLLPDIDLLVMNTYGTGLDVGELCRKVRTAKRNLPILHIGSTNPDGMPGDVPTLPETFTPENLLSTVRSLMKLGPPTSSVHPNGRRGGDTGPRSGMTGVALTDPGTFRALGRLIGRLRTAVFASD